MTKIAIVGAHRATKLDAPYDDAEWTIWSCSPRNESELPRHDVWFEIHPAWEFAKISPVYEQWLGVQPFVYMQKVLPEYPGSVAYPLERVQDAFGPYFWTGTVSYMMALAILQEPDVIGLWGFGQCPEESEQKPSIWHFIVEAERRGIEIVASKELLDPPVIYGPWASGLDTAEKVDAFVRCGSGVGH